MTALAAALSLLLLQAVPAMCQACDTATHALVGNPPACLPLFQSNGQRVTAFPAEQFGNRVTFSSNGNVMAVSNVPGRQPLMDAFAPRKVWVFARNGPNWVQQGPPFEAPQETAFGYKLALSADGSRLVVSAEFTNNGQGAVWTYRRSASGPWLQEGEVLEPPAITPPPPFPVPYCDFGTGLALAADGRTLVVGASSESSYKGVVRVYKRQSGGWTITQTLFTNSASTAYKNRGLDLALSADASTLAIMGADATFREKFVWVFARSSSSGKFKQQSTRMSIGYALSGVTTLALSADGSTLAANAVANTTSGFVFGAAVFVRQGTTWRKQGPNLVGTGAITLRDPKEQRSAVALSADGNTLAIGNAIADAQNQQGATWVFGRVNGAWFQLGPRLVGSQDPFARQGTWVSLSGDARRLAVGVPLEDDGTTDTLHQGGVWVFQRNAN